jgi:hypothetical protein
MILNHYLQVLKTFLMVSFDKENIWIAGHLLVNFAVVRTIKKISNLNPKGSLIRPLHPCLPDFFLANIAAH